MNARAMDHNAFSESYFLNLKLPTAYIAARRVADILSVILTLPLWLPLATVLYLVQLIRSGRPVIFVQDRPGHHGRYFRCYKFRTMTLKEKYDGIFYHEPHRVDRFNGFLRKHHFDEIPQVFNILKGDMSLIGPRPESYFYYEECVRHIPLYKYRFLIKPGLTGWSQAFYKHTDTIEEAYSRFDYDLYYMHHMNLKSDILVLLYTVKIIITGFGAK